MKIIACKVSHLVVYFFHAGIFLYAFAKKAKANISSKEEAALSLAAEAFISADDRKINRLLAEGSIGEVQLHE